MVNTVCNKCSHEFSLKAQDILTMKLRDIEAQYFLCESCKEIYITTFTDDYVRRRQIKALKLREAGKYEQSKKCIKQITDYIIRTKPRIKVILEEYHA